MGNMNGGWFSPAKSALFAGSDHGGGHWVVIPSTIETAKLNNVNPQIWLANTLSRLAAGHSPAAVDQRMLWNCATVVT